MIQGSSEIGEALGVYSVDVPAHLSYQILQSEAMSFNVSQPNSPTLLFLIILYSYCGVSLSTFHVFVYLRSIRIQSRI